MKKYFSLNTFINITLLLASISLTLVIVEVILPLESPLGNNYYVWTPNFSYVFKPLPDVMPGIKGAARYIVNSQGMRGDEWLPAHNYRILAVGGSTTGCAYLDQPESWPYILQQKLNKTQHRYKVWVGNIGKSGLTARDNIIQVKYLLQQYPSISCIIIMAGVNDFIMRLQIGGQYGPYFLYKPGQEEHLLYRSFYVFPIQYNKKMPFYRKTKLWHVFMKINHLLFKRVQDNAGKMYIDARKKRQQAIRRRDTLPDLSSALEEYSRNINILIDLAKKKSVRVIFLTQPFLWQSGLSEDLSRLLWLGWAQDIKEYYSIDALANGMRLYNQALLKVCQTRQVECFDIASLVSKDTNIFYDDIHFNENGSEKTAEVVVQYMLGHKPFNELDK